MKARRRSWPVIPELYELYRNLELRLSVAITTFAPFTCEHKSGRLPDSRRNAVRFICRESLRQIANENVDLLREKRDSQPYSRAQIVALDEDGRPSFDLLQGFGRGAPSIVLYAFDLLMLRGRDVRSWPLEERREHLRNVVKSLPETIRYSETFNVPLSDLMKAVKRNGLEGIVAKRAGSPYRSRELLRRLAQMESQPRTGVRDRRLCS